MPKWYRLRRAEGGYRTAAVRLRKCRFGPAGWSGGPSTVHTTTASNAEVRMVQATSRLRMAKIRWSNVRCAGARANHRALQTAAPL
ncbi:hypothetical protein DXU04_08055 [Bradyrhizobium diazoefficiens]